MNQQLASEKIKKKAAAIGAVVSVLIFGVLNGPTGDGLTNFFFCVVLSILIGIFLYGLIEVRLGRNENERE